MAGLYVFGRNGQYLVDNTAGNLLAPVHVADGAFTKVTAFQGGCILLDDTGKLFFIGRHFSDSFPLPGDDTTHFASPEQLPTPTDGAVWVSYSATNTYIMAIDSLGRLWSMGSYAPLAPSGVKSLDLIDDTKTWLICDASDAGTVAAINSDEELWTGGENGNGQCGVSSVSSPIAWGNRPISGYTFVDVSCRSQTLIALSANGTVFSCGWNFYGQTGRGAGGIRSDLGLVKVHPSSGGSPRIASGYDTSVLFNEGVAGGAERTDTSGTFLAHTLVESFAIDEAYWPESDRQLLLLSSGQVRVNGSNVYGQIGMSIVEPYDVLDLPGPAISLHGSGQAGAVLVDATPLPPYIPTSQFWTGFIKSSESGVS